MGAKQKVEAWLGKRVIGLIKAAKPSVSAPGPANGPGALVLRLQSGELVPPPGPGPGALVGTRMRGKTQLVPYTEYKASQGALIGAARTGSYRERGVSGLEVSGGRILEDYNQDMQDMPTRMRMFEEMRLSDAGPSVMENLVGLPVRQATWWMEGGDDENFKRRFWEDIQDDMSHPFDDLLRVALLAPLRGFSIHSIVSQVKADGFDGIRKFAERGNTTVAQWDFDATGGVQGFWQEGYRLDNGSFLREYIPIRDLVIWTWRKEKGNPEGIGAYRQAYKHFYMKEKLEEFAAIRVERTAIPIPVWTPPAWGMSEGDEDKILEMTDRLLVGENVGICVPAEWTLTFEWAGDADVPWLDFIQWEHQSMLQSVLGQFVGFGTGGQTAGAPLSRDASSLFLLMMDQIANWVCDTFNAYVVRPVWLRNKGTEFLRADSKRPPKLAHGRVGLRDMDAYGRFFRAVFDKNTMATVETLDFLIDLMGLPPMDEKDLQKIVDVKFSSGAAKQGGAGGFQDPSKTVPESSSAENGLANMEGDGS